MQVGDSHSAGGRVTVQVGDSHSAGGRQVPTPSLPWDCYPSGGG